MQDPERVQLVQALEACEIPAGAFHHEQHVRVAWSHFLMPGRCSLPPATGTEAIR